MLRVPENRRIRKGGLKTTASFGNNGVFGIAAQEILYVDDKPVKSPVMFICVVSDHDFFEQVAVTVQRPGQPRYPTHDELKALRNMFWHGEGDNVFTMYPNDSFKDDNAQIVTLWNKPGFPFPTPSYERQGIEKKSLIQKLIS